MSPNEKLIAFAFTESANKCASMETGISAWLTKCKKVSVSTEKIGSDDIHKVEEYLESTGAQLMSSEDAYVSAIMTKLIAAECGAVLLSYDDDKAELVRKIISKLKAQNIACYDTRNDAGAI